MWTREGWSGRRVNGQIGLTCGQVLGWPPVLIDSNSRLCGGGHLDRENGISERQALGKSCPHYTVGRSEHQPTCQDDPHVLIDSNFRWGASWQGRWQFGETSAWQKLFPLCWFARAGKLLGRFYCLQVANRLMYPLTANIPINHQHLHYPLIFPLTGNIPINR